VAFSVSRLQQNIPCLRAADVPYHIATVNGLARKYRAKVIFLYHDFFLNGTEK